MRDLDSFDLRILAVLRERGRETNVDVAKAVGLSHSSCSRRIARLEREGVITGYRAIVDPEALGLTVRAYCGAARSPDVPWDELARQLARIEGVVRVLAVTGEADLLLEIHARDMRHYAEVVLERVLGTPGVTGTRSWFVLSDIVSPRADSQPDWV